MGFFRGHFTLTLAAALFLAAAAEAQVKTNFASSITSESMATVWVARERGLFKKHGLHMQHIVMPRSPLAIAALMAGEIDAAQAQITLLTIPGTELNRRLAMESGSVDGTTLRGSVGDLYGQKGFGILYNFKATGMTLPQTMVVTSRRIAASKPQVIEAHLKTIVESIGILLDPANRESVTKTIAANLRLNNPADADEAYHSVINSYERVPYTSVDGMKRLHGLLTSINPKVKDVRVETVVDNSFISKLEQSGFVQSVWKK